MSTKYTGASDVNDVPFKFPLDLNGNLASNYIEDEIHTVSSGRILDHNLIVPRYAPFFVRDFKVLYRKTVNSKIVELKHGVDYEEVLYYKGGSEFTGIPIYGGIILHDLDLDGIVLISYRTLGGEAIADHGHVLKTLAENVWNPREKDWAYVAGTPNLYPPERHTVDWENITTLDDLLKSLDHMSTVIAESNQKLHEQIEEFLISIDVEKFRQQMRTLDQHSYTSLINENRDLKERIISLEHKYNDLNARVKSLGK